DVPAPPLVYLPALAFAALLAAFDGYWPFLPNLLTDWTNFVWFAFCFAIGAGLGLARRFDPPSTPLLAALSEAALPIYILHLVPVLVLGLVVLALGLPVWLAVAAIWIGATIVSLAAVRWLIR